MNLRTVTLVALALASYSFALQTAEASHVDACTMEYAPVCGVNPSGEQQTYGNRCALGMNHATYIHTGECRQSSDTTMPPASCKIWFDGCNTCRKGPGNSWACTLKGCMDLKQQPYCKEYESGGSGTSVPPQPPPTAPSDELEPITAPGTLTTSSMAVKEDTSATEEVLSSIIAQLEQLVDRLLNLLRLR